MLAVWALVTKRGPGGLLAMLLASLAAGTGVAGHLSEERSLEQSLAPHLAAQNVDGMVIPPWTRAAVSRSASLEPVLTAKTSAKASTGPAARR